MKRILWLATVLLVSVPVQAQRQVSRAAEIDLSAVTKITLQPTGNISVMATNTAVTKLVRTIAETAFNYEVIWRDVPRGAINVDIANADPNTALSMILSEIGYRFEKNDTDMTIAVYAQDRIQERPRQAAPVLDSRRLIVENLVDRYPAAYEQDGTISSFAQFGALQHEMAARYSGPLYQRYDTGFSYGLGHSYVQRMNDLDTWGGLKFKKGKEEFMKNVVLSGCGYDVIAQADEGNNIYDHTILVPVNCRPLIFTYSDGTDYFEVELSVLIVPQRLQDWKNFTLDKEFFLNARKTTERLRYTFQEQPDGSFKRVPR